MDKKQKEAIASLMKSGDRSALAELLVEYINPNHVATDFVGMLLDTKELKPGDALVKKVRKGIKVRTLVPGSIHLASEITTSSRVNYVLDGADVKVTANEWELESGELGKIADIKREMLLSLKDLYVSKVFTSLSSVWNATNTPDNYTSVGGSITATALEDAIDRINQTTGGVRAVVGTKAALSPVTKFGMFMSDGTNVTEIPSSVEEIKQSGKLGKYYGANILAIEQQYDNPEDYNALIPADKILVIGNNVGSFITFGDAKSKEWVDKRPTPPQWFFEIYQQFGMIIDRAEGIYVLDVS